MLYTVYQIKTCNKIRQKFTYITLHLNLLSTQFFLLNLFIFLAKGYAEDNQIICNNQIIYTSFYLALPQGQGHHNSVSQLLWARITYPTLSTFPVGGNRSTRRKPTTFGRALTILFSHEDWVQVHLTENRTRKLRGERRVV